jgi:lipid II:glycine glycyltransferase (peptidoglycan interpeptide bridge formation enzyme)
MSYVSSEYLFRELKDSERFDPLSLYDCVPFTQAYFYAGWQKRAGRDVRRFLIEKDGEAVLFAQIVKFPLPFGKHYYYSPYGPVHKGKCSDELLKCLREVLMKNFSDGVFARLDFTPECDGADKYLRRAPLACTHGGFFQPRVEWGTSLTESDDVRFSKLDKGTRYSINLAKKEGVSVEMYDADLMRYFDDFYSLMFETSGRNEFTLHPREYYEGVFDDDEKEGNTLLFMARRSGKVIGTAFVVIYGKSAMYAYAATRSSERRSQPSYAIVWHAMSEAKKRGAEVFNFGGITDDLHAKKSWEGLTQFKKKFTGSEIMHSELYDLVASPAWYWLYVLKKKLAK